MCQSLIDQQSLTALFLHISRMKFLENKIDSTLFQLYLCKVCLILVLTRGSFVVEINHLRSIHDVFFESTEFKPGSSLQSTGHHSCLE